MNKTYLNWKILVLGGVACLNLNLMEAFADRPAKEEFRERAAPEQPSREQRYEAESPNRDSDWKFRVSPGVSTWLLDEEDTEIAPAIHFDFWNTEVPLNYRVGIEGAHVNLLQDGVDSLADGPGRQPRLTFVRVPFAVEYKHDFNSKVSGYIGGGPDINIFANDASKVQVGGHLGARIAYAFNDHWGVSVDGGYMWASLDEGDADVDLNGVYITPLVTYTF